MKKWQDVIVTVCALLTIGGLGSSYLLMGEVSRLKLNMEYVSLFVQDELECGFRKKTIGPLQFRVSDYGGSYFPEERLRVMPKMTIRLKEGIDTKERFVGSLGCNFSKEDKERNAKLRSLSDKLAKAGL